jgi:hypothetical protein
MYDGVGSYDETDVDFAKRAPGFEMLFDLEADPGERDNLIESHAGSPILANLRQKCAEQSEAVNARREEFKKLVQVQRRTAPTQKKKRRPSQ